MVLNGTTAEKPTFMSRKLWLKIQRTDWIYVPSKSILIKLEPDKLEVLEDRVRRLIPMWKKALVGSLQKRAHMYPF